mmetsp:Transcript_76436/g.236026  ORF Transcript_76436/g.236026 Transcript_76436/m.236026 type:complete len:1023 (-) Transcript_76436:240-3308(-)
MTARVACWLLACTSTATPPRPPGASSTGTRPRRKPGQSLCWRSSSGAPSAPAQPQFRRSGWSSQRRPGADSANAQAQLRLRPRPAERGGGPGAGGRRLGSGGSRDRHQWKDLQAAVLEPRPDGRVLAVLVCEVLKHLVAVLQRKGALRRPLREERLAVPAGVFQALEAVEDLDHGQVGGRPEPLLDGVHDPRRCLTQRGHALEGAVGLAQHWRQLVQDYLRHDGWHALCLQLRGKAEVGQRRDKPVVERVASAQLPETEQSVQAVQQATFPIEDLVCEDVSGGVQVAVQDKRFHKLARLLHGILFQQFEAVRIVIDLLGLAPWSRNRLRRLLLGGGRAGLLRLALLLELQPLLLGGAHVGLLAVSTAGAGPHRLPAELPVVELEVNLDGVLGRPAEELVRVQLLLHAEHRYVCLQSGLPEAVVVEVKFVLGYVIEVLEGLAVHLQGLPEILLPAVAASHGGLIGHALHVVQVGSARRVGLLREEEGLLHALLRVVHPQKRPDALRVQEAVRQVHLPHLVKPLGRLGEVPPVPVDARLAGVDLDEGGRVLHRAVDVLQRPLRAAHKVKVIGRDHEGEEQARGRLLPRGVAGAGAAVLLANGGPEPGDLLLQVAQVAQQELLDEDSLVALEVEGPHHAEERGDALAQARAEVVVQAALEAAPRHEVEEELLQGVGAGMLLPQAVEKRADCLLLLLGEGHQGLVGLYPPLVLPPADGDPALDLGRVLRRQPAPDGHGLRVHGLREGADRRGQAAGAPVARPRRLRPSRRLCGAPGAATGLGPWRGQRGPEAVELGLAGHVGEHVDLVFGVDADQPPEDLGRLRVAPQEHAKAALHLQQADLVHDAPLVLPEALQGLLQLTRLLHDHCPVHEELGVLVLGHAVVLEGLLVMLYACPSKLVALAEVFRDRIAHPVEAVGGLDLQELPPGLCKSREVLAMDLQQGEVSQDLQVVGIDAQRLAVALDCLLVVLVLAVEQPKNMPTDVALQVVLQPLAHQIVRLFLAVEVAEREALHAKCLAMVRVLLED